MTRSLKKAKSKQHESHSTLSLLRFGSISPLHGLSNLRPLWVTIAFWCGAILLIVAALATQDIGSRMAAVGSSVIVALYCCLGMMPVLVQLGFYHLETRLVAAHEAPWWRYDLDRPVLFLRSVCGADLPRNINSSDSCRRKTQARTRWSISTGEIDGTWNPNQEGQLWGNVLLSPSPIPKTKGVTPGPHSPERSIHDRSHVPGSDWKIGAPAQAHEALSRHAAAADCDGCKDFSNSFTSGHPECTE